MIIWCVLALVNARFIFCFISSNVQIEMDLGLSKYDAEITDIVAWWHGTAIMALIE